MPKSAGAIALDIVMGKNTVTDVVRDAMKECNSVVSDASAGIGNKVSSIGTACTKMGAAMLPVSTAVVAVGKSAFNAASDFEDAMAKVSTIADTTTVPLGDLEASILDLSNQTGISASIIADNVYNAISAGQDTADAVNFVTNSTKLATAGFADAGQSLDLLTTILNAYGMEASEVTAVSDKLITTQNLGKTTVAELSSAMGKAIPTAKSVGINIDTLCGSYAVMTANGIATAETTTYLNSMMNELGKEGTSAAKAFAEGTEHIKAGGLSMKEAMDMGWSLTDVLSILDEKAVASGTSINNMFGSAEAGKAAAVLWDNASKLNDAVNQMGSSVGATDAAYEKMQTTSFDMQRTLNKLKNTFIELGGTLISTLGPILDSVSDKVAKFTTWFSNLDEKQKKTIVTVGLVVGAMAPLLLIFGKVTNAVGDIITGFKSVIGFISGSVVPALSSFFSFLIANPIVLVIAGIVAAGVLLVTHWEEVKAVAQAVWEGIKGIIEFAWEAIKIIIQVAMEFISALITSAWEIIMGIFTTVLNIIVSLVTMVWNTICTVIQTVMSIISDIISTVWNAICSIISGILNAIYSVVSSIWNAISSFITSIVTGIKNTAVNIFTSLKDGISTIIGNVKDTIVDGLNAAFDFIKGIPSQAIQWGKDMIQGLIDGIKSMIGAVGDAVKGVADKITGWLHFSRPDEGPLREYESWMPDFMGGLAKGIYDNEDLVTGALKDLTGKMSLNPSLQLNGVGLKEVGRVDQRTNENKVEQLLEAILEWLKNHPDPDGDNSPATIYLGGEFIGDYIDNRKTRNTIRSGGYA